MAANALFVPGDADTGVWPRVVAWLQDAVGGAILVWIAIADLRKFNTDWDALFYHLPFAALRTGLIGPADFVQRPDMVARMKGFPLVADYVQGWLWHAFNAPEATTLINPIAILVLGIYLRATWRCPLLWTVLVFLAVPILHVAIDSAYIDAWTNAFFALHVLAGWRALDTPRHSPLHAGISALALVVAAGSKPQFVALGGLSVVLLGAALLARHLRRRRDKAHRQSLVAILVFAAIVPLGFLVPIRNAIVHGNPLFPELVRLGHWVLSGTEANNWAIPDFLRTTPQPLRYLLSFADVFAVGGRPEGFNIDQSFVPQGDRAFRMGGSLSSLIITSLGVLTALLLRRRPETATLARLLWPAALIATVAFLPGSNELRYDSFVQILIVVAPLLWLRHAQQSGDRFAEGCETTLRAALLGSAVFIVALTGASHLTAGPTRTLKAYLAGTGISQELADTLPRASTICYLRPDKNALLYTHLFHRDISTPYRVVVPFDVQRCPPGSAVIR